jgi:hypothetical protein
MIPGALERQEAGLSTHTIHGRFQQIGATKFTPCVLNISLNSSVLGQFQSKLDDLGLTLMGIYTKFPWFNEFLKSHRKYNLGGVLEWCHVY